MSTSTPSPTRTRVPPPPSGTNASVVYKVGALLGLFVVLGLACFFALRRPASSAVAARKKAVSTSEKQAPAVVRISARPRASASGHVLDLEGKPVAGAQVCAWADASTKLSTQDRTAPRCTRSDAEGSYGLGDLFPATPLTIGASAKGFAPVAFRDKTGNSDVRLTEGERRLGVDLQFTTLGVEVRGAVSDITGGAVAQAVVMSGDAARSVGVTDAQGAFSLWVAPGEVSVEANASGYAPASDVGPAPTHFFKIQLVPGGTLLGRVVTAESESPVPGVLVEGIQMEGGYARASSFSDAEGHFRVEGLPPGRYRIEATSEGREGYSRAGVTLAMGESSSEIVVPMDPAYVVKAKIVEKGTGAPCTAGTVTLTDPDQAEFSTAPIEPDGTARMASVLPGTYRVEVLCRDHIKRDDYPKITLRDRDAPPLTLEVDPGAGLVVEVVDAHGVALKTAKVSASAASQDPSYAAADHPSPDGLFHLAGMKSGKLYYVMATTDDGGNARQNVTLTGALGQRIKLEVPTVGVIEGVVEDAAHRPVSNANVNASGASGYGYARTLEDGTFLMKSLAPGEYTVRLNDAAQVPDSEGEKRNDASSTAKVTLREGVRAKVRLVAEGRSGAVAGRVVDSSDKPVTDAMVDVARSNGSPSFPRWETLGRTVMTDMDGHFAIDSLPEGTFMLRAYRNGGSEVTIDGVTAGAKALVLKLEGGGLIAGAVTSKSGPVERFTLRVSDPKTGFSREELFFHASGTFSVGDLPPGNYKVSVDTPLGRADADVALTAGEQRTDLALTLAMRGTVKGVARDLDTGAPIEGASVMFIGASDGPIIADGRAATTGPDGRFTVERVLPGTWEIYVQSANVPAPARFPVTIADGSEVNVGDVRLASSRVAPGQRAGWLGFYAPVQFGTDSPLVVTSSNGPAAEAGIVPGDTIVSIDGYDVQGSSRYLYQTLVSVPSGTTVTVGLGRGATVRVTSP